MVAFRTTYPIEKAIGDMTALLPFKGRVWY